MKRININSIINIYMMILIFNIVNKGFEPFGIDIRYIVILLSVILLLIAIIEHKIRKIKINIDILLFYFTMFCVTFIANIFNNVSASKDFNNLLILNIYNLINIVIITIYSKNIKIDKIVKYFKIAILFLILSQIVTLLGCKLPFSTYFSETQADAGLKILLSDSYRITGYGIDPNYVALIMIIFISIIIRYETNKKKKILYIIMAVFSELIAFSRTILLISIPCALITYIAFKIKHESTKKYNYFNIAIMFCICMAFILITFIRPFENLNTMRVRYNLWSRAIEVTESTKLLGGGIGYIRQYGLTSYNWYVQCHSTFYQILSEQGVISVIIFLVMIYKRIKNANKPVYFSMLLYFIWSFTYETVYLSYFIFIFAILPMFNENEREVKNEEDSIRSKFFAKWRGRKSNCNSSK